MLWTACCLVFFGFLRATEFTAPPSGKDFDAGVHLSLQDIALDSRSSPNLVRVKIKHSITDPFRQGVEIYLGRSFNKLYPMEVNVAYLGSCRGNRVSPFFQFHNGTPLSRQWLVIQVHQALLSAGKDPAPYSGHSFRIGAASTAAKRSVEDLLMKILGCWQSSAYQRYVKIPSERLAVVSNILVSE